MDTTKLKQIIKDKNERLEENTLRSAAAIIDMIAQEQKKITDSNQNIEKLRKELKELEVETIDPKTILG